MFPPLTPLVATANNITRSRLRILREAHRSEIKTRHHGRYTLLDGPRGRQTARIRPQSRHVVPRDHGHRDDRVGAAVPKRRTAQSSFPHYDERHPHTQEPRPTEPRAQGLPVAVPDCDGGEPGDGRRDFAVRVSAQDGMRIEDFDGSVEV